MDRQHHVTHRIVVVPNGNPLAEIRMPAIIDLDFIADMGRMNGLWRWKRELALRGSRYGSGDLGTRHDDHRDGKDEWS